MHQSLRCELYEQLWSECIFTRFGQKFPQMSPKEIFYFGPNLHGESKNCHHRTVGTQENSPMWSTTKRCSLCFYWKRWSVYWTTLHWWLVMQSAKEGLQFAAVKCVSQACTVLLTNSLTQGWVIRTCTHHNIIPSFKYQSYLVCIKYFTHGNVSKYMEVMSVTVHPSLMSFHKYPGLWQKKVLV